MDLLQLQHYGINQVESSVTGVASGWTAMLRGDSTDSSGSRVMSACSISAAARARPRS